LGGKTTNLRYIYSRTSNKIKGQLISIDTGGDRTLFFDFLSLNLGTVGDLRIRIQLYTVPGQVQYEATRKLVLKGVDGVVFVADSMKVQRERNIESLKNLSHNLEEMGMKIETLPLVMQYNKRDLERTNIPILSVEEMERDLNAELHVPSFSASALRGWGVFDTLREISKIVVKDVSRKILLERKEEGA